MVSLAVESHGVFSGLSLAIESHGVLVVMSLSKCAHDSEFKFTELIKKGMHSFYHDALNKFHSGLEHSYTMASIRQ